MYPLCRRTGRSPVVSCLFSTSSRFDRFFGTTFSLLAAMLLPGAPASHAQAVSGSVSLVPIINTVAGDGTGGYSGDGAAAASAGLYYPVGVALDSTGNLYIADNGNNRIRKVDTSGNISTVVGNGTGGYSGDGAAATSAELRSPTAVTVDGAGNIYLADNGNNRIRKVDTSGIISTVAGNGTGGYSGDGAAATSAEINSPYGVVVDSAGNIYIADRSNQRIRKVDTSGNISTVAGNGTPGYSGDGAAATSAELSSPSGVAVDSAGNIYIADAGNNRIRKVDTSGNISTAAGNGTGSYSGDGAPATSAELNGPSSVAVDSAGQLYIGDESNNRIRKVDTAGDISTVAGSGTQGYRGDGAAAASAEFHYPTGLAVDSTRSLYIADQDNHRIRKVSTSVTSPTTAVGATSAAQNIFAQLTAASPISTVTVPMAQNGAQEFTVGTVSDCVMDGITSNPVDTICTVPITFNPQYPGLRTGELTLYSSGTTILGTVGLSGAGAGPQVAFGPPAQTTIFGASAALNQPFGIAIDGSGNIFIADTANARVLRETPAGSGSYAQTTIGSGWGGAYSVAVDAAGNVYVADTNRNSVFKETPTGGGNYTQTTAVSGLFNPTDAVVDGSGNLYIVDFRNNRVLKETVTASGYTQTVVVGGLHLPWGVAVDLSGNVYITDTYNSRVLKETPSAGGYTQTLVGNGWNYPEGVAVDPSGNLYITDYANNNLKKVTPAGGQITIGSGWNHIRDVVLDGSGNLYVADGGNNRIVEENVATPPALSFASTSAGSTSSAQTVTLNNIGTSNLDFAVPTSGLNPSISTNFSLSNSSTCPQLETASSPAMLASGSSCTLLLSFTPTRGGALTGTASITDNSLNANPNATQIINLSGTGSQGTQTITFPQPVTPVTYGTAPATLTATASSGLAVAYSVTGGPATVSGSILTFTGTGTVGVAASQSGDTNYQAATPVSDTIVVNKATLMVTAANATRAYGAANPVFTGTYTGAVNGDTFIISGTTTATTSSPVGSYPIVPTAVGTNLADYTVAASNGTLTVTAGTTTALTSSASAITAGQSVTFTAAVKSGTAPVTSGTVTFLNGAASIGTGALNAQGVATFTTSTLPAGAEPSFTASYGGTANYAASTSAPVTVIVTVSVPAIAGTTTTVTSNPTSIPAGGSVVLTATVASSSGTPTGTVTFTSGGVSLGTANLSAGIATLTATTLPVGTDVVTAGYGGAASFAASTGSASVTVNAAPPAAYSVTTSASSLTIAQGQTGGAELTLTPTGGYTGTVTFSCQGLPANAVCAFAQNPIQLTGDNQPVNVGLTIETSVQQGRIEAPPKPMPSPLSPILSALSFWWPGSLAGLAVFGRKRKLSMTQHRWFQLCLLLVMTGAFAAGLSGCGSGAGFGPYVTPVGTSTVTVLATATSGANVTTQTVALTIHIAQ